MRPPPEFRVAAEADGLGHFYPADKSRRTTYALCGAAPIEERWQHPVAERCAVCRSAANELTKEALRGPAAMKVW